jgi:hypothetical protein
MPFPNEHAARLTSPDKYIRFRRDNDKGGSGVDFIFGVTKDGTAELQAIRFDKTKFTVDQARAWLKDHKHTAILFEPAAGGSNNSELDYETVSSALAPESAIESWQEIAAAGKFPQGDLTPEIFDEVVKNFKPAEHEPPMTLGHVTRDHNDRPAMGWIAGLKRVGNKLLAKGRQISRDLDDLVRSGRFKKRSIGLRYLPDGSHYLHHLAWLGATGPAVKGLKDVYMDYLDIDSQKNYETETEINLTKGVQVKTFTEEELRNETAKARREGTDAGKAEAKTEFDETIKTREKAAEDKGKADAKKEFDDKQKTAEQVRNFRSDVDSRIKKLFDDKKIIPAQVEPLRALGYSMQETTELTFSEADPKDKTKKVERKEKPLDLLFQVAETAKAPEGKLEDPDNPDAKGGENYAEEKKKARELMKEDETLTFGDAIKKVRAEKKEAEGDGDDK